MSTSAEPTKPTYSRVTPPKGEAQAVARVKSLAATMRVKKKDDETFVLMLGAGASITSGVPPTAIIMRELVETYGKDLDEGTTDEKFDRLWRRTTDSNRARYLEPYLSKRWSSGYDKLAELIKEGYFDLVVTFNFDELLDNALRKNGCHDFSRIVRGEASQDRIQRLLDQKRPRIKLLKLHGSLTSADYFVFDEAETAAYPPQVEEIVRSITRRDIIVCGYAFNDECVSRAFSTSGDSIVCLNPGGVPKKLKRFLHDRRSEELEIRLDFDTFFTTLHRELLGTHTEPQQADKPPRNPFKFLEGYHEADGSSFKMRDGQTQKFLACLDSNPVPRAIVIAGPAGAGKTSFVHAGILSRLDPDKYFPVYLRAPAADSRVDIEAHLRTELLRSIVTSQAGSPESADLKARCDNLGLRDTLVEVGKTYCSKTIMVILDQFDRVTQRLHYNTKPGNENITAFLRDKIFGSAGDNLVFVFVVIDESLLGMWLAEQCGSLNVPMRLLTCPFFDSDDVVQMMDELAAEASLEFDRTIFVELAQMYEQGKKETEPDKRFTLTHIQAICHILAETRNVTYEDYKAKFDQNLGALNQAINVSDITSFVEDCAWPNSAWCRNLIKVPLQQSKEQIAAFVKAHYEDLVPAMAPPGTRPKAYPGPEAKI